MPRVKNVLMAIKEEVKMWEEGVTYEEEALQLIENLCRERLAKLGMPRRDPKTGEFLKG